MFLIIDLILVKRVHGDKWFVLKFNLKRFKINSFEVIKFQHKLAKRSVRIDRKIVNIFTKLYGKFKSAFRFHFILFACFCDSEKGAEMEFLDKSVNPYHNERAPVPAFIWANLCDFYLALPFHLFDFWFRN